MDLSNDGLLDLTEIIRKNLRSRTSDWHLVEDLTQETIVKIAAVETRLAEDELRAYAIVTSRNALFSHLRRQVTVKRHAHRLVSYKGFDGPEELTLEREETDALAIALQKLPAADRQLLLDHESNDISIDELATLHDTTRGSIAMRLARARAALRVEFVLAFRHIEDIPVTCRNTLLAISAGDARRQRELGTEEHLLFCKTCASISKPIVQRRRGIAAWLILPVAEAMRRFLKSLRHSHVTQAVTAAAASVAVGATVFALRPEPNSAAPPPSTQAPVVTTQAVRAPAAPSPPSTSTPAPSTTPTPVVAPPTTVDGCAAAAAGSPIDASIVGCPVHVEAAPVAAVPADEGFWITAGDGSLLWVHLVGADESPESITAGQIVTFDGSVVANTPSFDNTGAPVADQAELARRGVHLDVEYASIQIVS